MRMKQTIVILLTAVIVLACYDKQQQRTEEYTRFINYQTQYTWYSHRTHKIEKLDRLTYEIIRHECIVNPFPLHYALAFCYSESRFYYRAISNKNALGLFQIMAKQHKLNPRRLLTDIRYNTKHGIKILKMCFRNASGNIIKACKNYNAGTNGTKYNGKYIIEICHNVVTSKPDTRAVELLKI